MAGHFILKSITQSDLATATGFAGITWSGLAHPAGQLNGAGGAFPGWTHDSRTTLSTALANRAIPNRDNLPPHRYLEIAAGLYDNSERYVRGAGWVSNLIRPTGAGLGLRALTANANLRWTAHDKDGAFQLQHAHGAVSVEVYYMAGYEMS